MQHDKINQQIERKKQWICTQYNINRTQPQIMWCPALHTEKTKQILRANNSEIQVTSTQLKKQAWDSAYAEMRNSVLEFYKDKTHEDKGGDK